MCLGILLLVAPFAAQSEESISQTGLAIVVHADTEADDVSMAELRNIFLANKQFWPDRSRIILLVRAPESDERDYVLDTIYQMNEDEGYPLK